MNELTAKFALKHPRVFETVVYGGLAIGVLDGLAACVSAYLSRGTSPFRVFQFIASGLLGRDSFNGGTATALLGVLLHFVIAFGVATVFYLLSRTFPLLIKQAILSGLLYGIAVHFVMQNVVVELSAVTRTAQAGTVSLTPIIIHALFVGLPVALIARWSVNNQTNI